MKKLTLFIVVFILNSCGVLTTLPKDKNVIRIDHMYGVTVEYFTNSDLRQQQQTKAEMSFMTTDELNKKLNEIPVNGQVFIRFQSPSLEFCNPGNYEYVFTSINDSIIKKSKGYNNIPNVSELTGNFWNIDIKNIPVQCPDTINMYIIWLKSDRAKYQIVIPEYIDDF